MTNRQIRCLALSVFGASISMGCSSGGMSPGDAGTSGAVAASVADYAGTWDGRAEASSFGPDGSDRVRLTLDRQGNGTLQLGEGSVPAATDPGVPYPPDWKTVVGSNALSEGFEYPLRETRVEVGRLQTGVYPHDVFASWCVLQTPGILFLSADGDAEKNTYACEPGSETTFSTADAGTASNTGYLCGIVQPDGSIQTIDCDKWTLCTQDRVCTCSATACGARPIPDTVVVPAQFDVNLDVSLDASKGTLNGTMAFFGARLTVHLTRK